MATQKRVWLIDDDRAFLGMLAAMLERAGYVVVTANDLTGIHQLMHTFDAPPDLVLLDVQMPELFGDELALMLRTVRNVRAPIYLVSAMEEAELAARAKAAGVDGWLSKAVGGAGIVARVRVILGGETSG